MKNKTAAVLLVVGELFLVAFALGWKMHGTPVQAQNSGYSAIVPNNKDGGCPANSVAVMAFSHEPVQALPIGNGYIWGQTIIGFDQDGKKTSYSIAPSGDIFTPICIAR